MSEFTVSGWFRTREGRRTFEKTVTAPNEDVAREHVYAAFGSEHGLGRNQVGVEEVDG